MQYFEGEMTSFVDENTWADTIEYTKTSARQVIWYRRALHIK